MKKLFKYVFIMKCMDKKFKFLEHTADIKFQAFGKTKTQMFENAGLAMFKATSDDSVKSKIKKTISVKGKDNESLMYNFLEELLFLFDTQHFILSKIKIKINEKDKSLTAKISGDFAEDYDIKIDIKAVTYNEMFVKKDTKTGIWVCQVVLDV